MTTPIYPGVSLSQPFKGRMEGFIVGDIDKPKSCPATSSGDLQDIVNMWDLDGPPVAEVANVVGNPCVQVWCVASSRSPRGETLLGISPSHAFDPAELPDRVDRVFEFHGYGVMLLDGGRGEVQGFVVRRGDKAAVPAGATVALLNLGDYQAPLVAVAVSRTEAQLKPVGSLLVGTANTSDVILTVNQACLFAQRGHGGIVTSAHWPREHRSIRIPNDSRLDLGAFLHRELTRNPTWIAAFDRLNIRLREAHQTVVLPQAGSKNALYCSLPLVMLQRNSGIYKYLEDSV